MEDAKKKTGGIGEGDVQMCRNLIPRLPDELAMECLVRVPYQFHSAIKSVCRSWRSLLSHPSFYRERRRSGKAEHLLCVVQPLTPPPIPAASPPPPPVLEVVGMTGEFCGEVIDDERVKKSEDDSQQPRVYGTPRYGLSVYNTASDEWHRVRLPEPIPLFCECVALQAAGKLLLIGGWDPETLQPVRDVFVLDFAGEGGGRRWRRGAPLAVARSFFACAAVGSTKVYVAGGHDDQKNALRSAEVYDVEKDEWETLPPMAEGRDECHGFAVAEDLGVCVLSGYGTETQGHFRSDAELYDPASNSWSKIENVWPFPDTSPRGRTTAVAAGGGGDVSECRLWCFTSTERQSQPRREIEDKLKKWRLVVETIQLPTAGTSVFAGSLGGIDGDDQALAMAGGGMKCGGECEGEGGMMIMMTTTTEKHGGNGNGKWSHVHTPLGFSSIPFSHASICV